MAMSVVSRSVLNDQTRALQTPADQGLFPCNRATPVPVSVLLAPWETPTRVASGGLPDLDSTLTKIFFRGECMVDDDCSLQTACLQVSFPCDDQIDQLNC